MPRYEGPDFAVQRRTVGTTTEVVVRGEVDIASCPGLRREVEAAMRHGPQRVVIDLREVSFIDSAGINALLRLRSRAIAQWIDMSVMRPAGSPDRIFQLCGMEGIFPKPDGTDHRPGGPGSVALQSSQREVVVRSSLARASTIRRARHQTALAADWLRELRDRPARWPQSSSTRPDLSFAASRSRRIDGAGGRAAVRHP